MQWITGFKVSLYKKLLLNADDGVTSIRWSSVFSNQSDCTKCLEKYQGATPHCRNRELLIKDSFGNMGQLLSQPN
ncbi:hypothetical protein HCH_03743 [Hahella chejuensis KCTC 2396]|uniref:HTH araC/xylS-type domain-containing protein n=1 Tax=Hahella chejuensis (strain KCTC 2396) TaxID=349521 RepID=Q2SFU7_HAHCH|nr:hypothetical protein HCH_03743 [Hahella chejuensis KCTC 2396]